MTARTTWTADELPSPRVFPNHDGPSPDSSPRGSTCSSVHRARRIVAGAECRLAIASGGRALGRVPVEHGEVLYLALEDTGRRLQDRLRIILAGQLAPAGLTLTTECEPLTEGGTERIEWWLEQHPTARLIIIDVFTRVRGQSSDRTNRYEADYTAMASIKHIADLRRGVPGGASHPQAGRRRLPRLGKRHQRHRRRRRRDPRPFTKPRECGSHPESHRPRRRGSRIHAQLRRRHWYLADARRPAADYELGESRRRIVQLVREHGPMTPSEIAYSLELNPNTTKVTVRRMVDDDQLATAGDGRYLAPPTPVTHVTRETLAGQDTDSAVTPPVGRCNPKRPADLRWLHGLHEVTPPTGRLPVPAPRTRSTDDQPTPTNRRLARVTPSSRRRRQGGDRRSSALARTPSLRSRGARQFRELGATEEQRDHCDDEQELPADDLADYGMHAPTPRPRVRARSDTRRRPRQQRLTRPRYEGFDGGTRADGPSSAMFAVETIAGTRRRRQEAPRSRLRRRLSSRSVARTGATTTSRAGRHSRGAGRSSEAHGRRRSAPRWPRATPAGLA